MGVALEPPPPVKVPAGKKRLIHEPPPSLRGIIEQAQALDGDCRGYLRPSSLWGCERACVYLLTRAPKSPDLKNARLKRILDVGTATHTVVQGYLANHPEWWFAPEARVEVVVEGVRIKGSCDGILIRRSDGYRFGIEIKTKKHDLFDALVTPDPDHVRQASLYAKLHRVYWITILYWDKDQQHLKEYPVSYEEGMWESIKERIRTIKAFAEKAVGEGKPLYWENIDPECMPPFVKKRCDVGFCNYWEICRSHGAPVP